MPSYWSPQVFQEMLNRQRETKQQTKRPYMTAPEYETLVPQELNFKPNTNDLYNEIRQKILDNSKAATAIEMIKAQNRFNFQQYQDARQGLNLAQKNFTPYNPSAGGSGPAVGSYSQKQWGKDGVPEVSDIRQLQPHAPLRTMSFHGMNYTVNSQVAPIFQAFLTDLWSKGYRPKSIQGYNYRNIAGSNQLSLHSYGFAIDVDPSRNPVTYNGQVITALPPGIGALAAKYGLSWGGSWRSYKDPMHFSVPYGGRE